MAPPSHLPLPRYHEYSTSLEDRVDLIRQRLFLFAGEVNYTPTLVCLFVQSFQDIYILNITYYKAIKIKL